MKKILVAALFASSFFDMGTTLDGLRRCNCRESNPLASPFTKHTVTAYAFSAGTSLTVVEFANIVRKSGHPKFADGLVVFGIASHGVDGVRNLRVK